MTKEKMYEILGNICEAHVEEAGLYRKKRSARFKWVVAACLCLGLILGAVYLPTFYREPGNPVEPSGGGEHPHNNVIVLTFEQIVSEADLILEAVYTGRSTTEYGTELVFKPIKAVKGQIDGEVNVLDVSSIYVQPIETQPEYEEGQLYLLFLEKHSSVYYDHDKYSQLGELFVPRGSALWEEYREKAETIAASEKDSPGDPEEKRFLEQAATEEVIDFAENIFLVRIDSILAESTVTPTTVYNATVLKTVKNTPAANGKIYLTLFNGMVTPGETYLVLLADATKSAPVYTLASRENSLFSLEEAGSLPALKTLLDQAAAYAASGEE